MSTKKCCMINCDSELTKDDARCYYAFPRNFSLCMLWVQNSGKPEFFEDFAYGGAEPFLRRYICSNHFLETDFLDVKNKSFGLVPGAIPQLNDIRNIANGIKPWDGEYMESREGISSSDMLLRIKSEEIENDIYDNNGNDFSLSSNDDSYGDLHISKFIHRNSKEAEEEINLSKEFFRNYEDAKWGLKNIPTNRERLKRLKKDALKAQIRRAHESDEQKNTRKMKNALRAAFRRRNETTDQRETRRRKDMIRAQMRRYAETEQETQIRRYNDAVRAAFRRNNETDEQRRERKLKDSMRAARRRSMETSEQRASRLLKDRERASKRRMLKKIVEQMNILEGLSEIMPVPLPEATKEIRMETNDDECQETKPLNMSTISSAVRWCNESTNMSRLEQVLAFIRQRTKKQKKQLRKRRLSKNDKNSLEENIQNFLDFPSLDCKVKREPVDYTCVVEGNENILGLNGVSGANIKTEAQSSFHLSDLSSHDYDMNLIQLQPPANLVSSVDKDVHLNWCNRDKYNIVNI